MLSNFGYNHTYRLPIYHCARIAWSYARAPGFGFRGDTLEDFPKHPEHFFRASVNLMPPKGADYPDHQGNVRVMDNESGKLGSMYRSPSSPLLEYTSSVLEEGAPGRTYFPNRPR